MKRFSFFFIPLLTWFFVSGCNGSGSTGTNGDPATISTDSGALKLDSSAGSTAGFKLGIQMWTFKEFSFSEALDKVDSSGIKNIEVFMGQKLGGGLGGVFNIDMPKETRNKLKAVLQKKGIQVVALGVFVPKNQAEWIKTFELAKEFGLSYIVSEPIKTQWGMIDSLAGVYGIPVAIHDHPRPNPYWSPDSVLAALTGHPHLGACADIGHWSRSGLNPVDCMKKLDGRIIDVHFKDIVKFDDTKALDTVVSLGVINFPDVLAELKRQNFKGMITIEHESNWLHNLPDVIVTKNYYDSLLSKLQ